MNSATKTDGVPEIAPTRDGVELSVVMLDRAIAEITYLRAVAGAVSKGESFSEIQTAAKQPDRAKS